LSLAGISGVLCNKSLAYRRNNPMGTTIGAKHTIKSPENFLSYL
jgi:hypothetical protein